LGGCLLTAVAGVLSVLWYAAGALDDEEIEAEENLKADERERRRQGN
jgi:hypothetical protein